MHRENEEWVVRKELRDAEVEGMNEALKILTSDEARELFATDDLMNSMEDKQMRAWRDFPLVVRMDHRALQGQDCVAEVRQELQEVMDFCCASGTGVNWSQLFRFRV